MKMPNVNLPHFSRFYIEASDFKQTYVIAKNETIKSVRGKKFLVACVIIALVFALITLIPIMLNQDIVVKGYGGWVSNYLSYVTMFITLIAALIGSISLVSEYEERTALILFTRPVKKTTIFLGKFISSFLLCTLMMVVYYIGVLVVGLYYFNTVSDHLLESLAMCIMFVFASVSIAFLFSAIFKRGSVAIISTILAILIVIPVITMMISGDKSFMLDIAGNSTITCIPEYVAKHNESIDNVTEYFGKLIEALKQSTVDPTELADLVRSVEFIRDMILSFMTPLSAPDIVHDAIVMFGWGIVSLTASWILFLRKQF